MYRAVPKHQKIIVAKSIIHAVGKQNPPGRFLERDRDSKLWYEVPFDRAVEKAKQALRERGKDEEDYVDDDDEDDYEESSVTESAAGSVRSTTAARMIPGTTDFAPRTVSSGGGGGGGGGGGTALAPHGPTSSSASVPVAAVSSSVPVLAASSSTAAAATATATAPPFATTSTSTSTSTLANPADEIIAARFLNMLRLNVCPSVVEAKMRHEGISHHIVAHVLTSAAAGGAGARAGAQPPPPPPPPPPSAEHHVQFAAGTHAAAPVVGGGGGAAGMGYVPPRRRVSSVLLGMFGFGDTGEDGAAAGGGGGTRGSGSCALPPEVRDVIDAIAAEDEKAVGGNGGGGGGAGRPATAAAPPAPMMDGPSDVGSGADATGGATGGAGGGRPNRRRSSVFNIFRRKSRSVGGGGLTFSQRACTSIVYDTESQRKLLVELEEHDVSDNDVPGPASSAGGPGAGHKRKASEIDMSRGSSGSSKHHQQQHQQRRGKTMAEAAALVAAEDELEELEPEDLAAPPKRLSFSPALFGKMFSAFGGQDEEGNPTDGAGNWVEAAPAPAPAPAPPAAAAAPSSPPGLLRQSTAAARRSFVATVNLFSSVAGAEGSIGSSNISSTNSDGGADIEPHIKRRRRSTWLSGLRFSTMEPAVAGASSAAAAAEAVRNMDLVDDDLEDTPDTKRLRSLGKGTVNGDTAKVQAI